MSPLATRTEVHYESTKLSFSLLTKQKHLLNMAVFWLITDFF